MREQLSDGILGSAAASVQVGYSMLSRAASLIAFLVNTAARANVRTRATTYYMSSYFAHRVKGTLFLPSPRSQSRLCSLLTRAAGRACVRALVCRYHGCAVP